ncbi:MAG: Uma2 family endonuclease [Pirellulales bacterium]
MATTSLANTAATAEVVVPIQPDSLLLSPAADGRVRFSRAAYHRMADAGILDRNARFELIEGDIYMMSPIGPAQGALVRRLTQFFTKRLPDTIDCSIQLPIFSAEHSEPEPDVALIRQRDDDYRNEHPSPKDVLLIIEVAQSSLGQDLGTKLRLYASSAIPEYWVVDVHRQVILVHREPIGNSYRVSKLIPRDGVVAPIAAPECELDAAWLFR